MNRAAGPTSAKDKGAGAPGTPVTPAGSQHGKLGTTQKIWEFRDPEFEGIEVLCEMGY